MQNSLTPLPCIGSWSRYTFQGKMATADEDKLAVSNVKTDPVNSETQSSADLSNSETLPNNNLVDSKVQPNNDSANSDPQPKDIVASSETLPSSDITDSETHPKNDVSDSEAQPNNEGANSEAQPNNDGANSDIQPHSNVTNSDTQPHNDIAHSEVYPEIDVANSETQPPNEIANSESHLLNEIANSESLLFNEITNSEFHPQHDVANSEFHSQNDVANSKAQLHNDVANDNTQPHNGVADSEAGPNSVVAVSETQPDNYVADSETETVNILINSGTQPDSDLAHSKHQPPDQLNSETHHSNDLSNAETQQTNDFANSEKQSNDGLANSGAQPIIEVANADTQPNSQLVCSEELENQMVNSETAADSQLVNSDKLPDNQLIDSAELHTNQLAYAETAHENSLVKSERLVDDHIATSEMEVDDQPGNFEPLPEDHPGNFETLPENHLAHSEAPPEIQMVDSETIPEDQLVNSHKLDDHNQLANSEALHEDQLAYAEELHDNQLVKSETLARDHLGRSEMLVDNHPGNFETLPDNQLTHSETQNQYDLAYSETMHNSQLSSQTIPNYELANHETLPSYELVNSESQLNNEVINPEVQPNKRRKKKSIVWEHFTIETVSPGCRRACCKQCKQSFAYSTGTKVAGTSHLKRHIAKGTCPALLRNQENQLSPYTPRSRTSGTGTANEAPKRRYRSPSTPYIIFDQDRCRHEIARMIIMHDYPLHMVEHPGFVAFVQNLQPQFNMVTFNTVQGDCVATYLMEKQHLMKVIEGIPGRVCLTLDMWTSSQSVGYVFISGHFIDGDWKMQRRILNVVMEPYPDSDSALSHAISACLSDWNLEGRLFSITLNQPRSEAVLENLRPLISVKNPQILKGQLLVGNCIARTLSSVAKDVLGSAPEIIKRIRDSVKYVKTSESHEEKFLELKQQLQVPSERSLFLDDQSLWNTTYQMLVAASELKEVFSCLDTSDPDYKGAPSMEDWKLVETLCTYLKPIFDAANILTTTTQPTPIAYFHEVWKFQLDLSRSVTSEDPFISNITKTMQENIGKYWRNCSLVLAIAVVMDPRFKMKLVEFSFTKIYGEEAPNHINIVNEGIHELFHEYVALPLPLTPTYAEDGGSNIKMEESGGTLLSESGLSDFDVYIMESTGQHMKSEVDQYLDESLLPRVADFDVLGWWKINKLKYPTLSRMARDILSIQVSSVPPDSIFDTKSKEMDQYRNSLRPETVEALVCAKDWMQYGSAEAANALVKMEF
ncbi:zinc finger BED domain-containing protein DAYSLEEPER-like [Quillaja saponaria]|uniref:Zinc finger BED domain-containing protein DAYSLEEPER-like n=1 Tax=Quillaja saponaria TaxID=32244 RepID=A0AAD7LEK7_QUISA|nr:zinc finger BED domain-containing protein DAYSLEEPER-like [Quillaja saponaria]